MISDSSVESLSLIPITTFSSCLRFALSSSVSRQCKKLSLSFTVWFKALRSMFHLSRPRLGKASHKGRRPSTGKFCFPCRKKELRFITFKANLESRIIKLDCGAKRRAFRIISLDLFAITHWFESLSTY